MINVPTVLAAGGLVYRQSDVSCEVILVGSGQPIQWRLPKGMLDSLESLEQAAIREVQEECGAVARIVAWIDDKEWTYEYEGRWFKKITSYYLMQFVGGDLGNHDDEFDHVIWTPAYDAAKLLFFEAERSIAVKGHSLLRNRLGY